MTARSIYLLLSMGSQLGGLFSNLMHWGIQGEGCYGNRRVFEMLQMVISEGYCLEWRDIVRKN